MISFGIGCELRQFLRFRFTEGTLAALTSLQFLRTHVYLVSTLAAQHKDIDPFIIEKLMKYNILVDNYKVALYHLLTGEINSRGNGNTGSFLEDGC